MCWAVTNGVIRAAESAIPKSGPGSAKKIVPWWTKECRKAIKERNKSFRILKKTLNFETLIKYKQCQAVVRCTVKKAKREYWKAFCETLGQNYPNRECLGND